MKPSRTIRNSTPAAFAITQDIHKKKHFHIILEKYSANLKIKLK